MEQALKRGRGRPAESGVYPVEKTARLTEAQSERLRELALSAGVSQAAYLRLAFEEKAAREVARQE